ncbi:hypothetical protein AB0862_035735, partial [Acinetobacter baumannii]
EKEAQAHLICPKGQSCIIPIPEKSLGDKALNVINDMTLRQLAAVAGAKYDPLTGEEITPNERQLAKASMLGLGFTKSVSGVTRLTDEALVGIEKQYGKSIAEKINKSNAVNLNAQDALNRKLFWLWPDSSTIFFAESRLILSSAFT